MNRINIRVQSVIHLHDTSCNARDDKLYKGWQCARDDSVQDMTVYKRDDSVQEMTVCKIWQCIREMTVCKKRQCTVTGDDSVQEMTVYKRWQCTRDDSVQERWQCVKNDSEQEMAVYSVCFCGPVVSVLIYWSKCHGLESWSIQRSIFLSKKY